MPLTRERLAANTATTPTGCLEWTGARDRGGYGAIRVDGKVLRAHRVAWQLANPGEPLPPVVRHRCDNPPCCNPEHLEAGTHRDNVNDAVERGRLTQGAAHHKATLTDAQVAELRSAYAAGGVTQRALAARYGISQPSVSALVRRAFRT